MNRKTLQRWAAFFLTIVLVIGCMPGALAAKKNTKCDTSAFSDLISGWLYLPDTVPEAFRNEFGPVSVSLYPKSGNGKSEYCPSITAEFVSGDEALKDAIRITVDTESVYSGGESREMEVASVAFNLDGIQSPTEAVFHFICESEHYVLEQDVPLRILSWEDYPLFETPEENPVIMLQKNDRRTVDQLLAGLFVDHSREISKALQMDTTPSLSPRGLSFRDRENGEYINMDYYFVGATNAQEEPKTKIALLMSPFMDDTYQFREYGVYDTEEWIQLGNVRTNLKATYAVLPYSISGGSTIAPGETAQVTVQDAEPEKSRSFILSLEGEGVTLDPDTGILSAAADAELGTPYTLTAIPSDGGYAVTVTGRISNGALGNEKFESSELCDGFTVPLLSSEDGVYENGYTHRNRMIARRTSDAPYVLFEEAVVYGMDEFLEDREIVMQIHQSFNTAGLEEVETEYIDLDGHPVMLLTGKLTDDGDYYGVIQMARNDRLLRLRMWSSVGEGGEAGNLPRITREDLLSLVDQIKYDPSQAPILLEDGMITLSAKDDAAVVSGGKKLKLTATFANKERVNKKAKNDKVEWSVIDVNTQAEPENVTVDKNGTLSAGAKLAEVKYLEVRASSPIFHTQATYQVTAIPAVKKITTDPAELFFYVGTDTPQTVKAVLEPDTVPPTGITWTPAKKDIVDIAAGEDGTAEIRPLTAGKITVTVKEPGGKSAKLKVNVVEPVTGLELSTKGKAQAGKTVTVTAAMEPKKAGNKALEWSVDVDESIATISQKGQVKISKAAAAGTEITVTCKALGAPEPIVQTLVIIVE